MVLGSKDICMYISLIQVLLAPTCTILSFKLKDGNVSVVIRDRLVRDIELPEVTGNIKRNPPGKSTATKRVLKCNFWDGIR